MENNKQILHKHLIPFEGFITQLGIVGRIRFEEAMLKAMEEYKAEIQGKEWIERASVFDLGECKIYKRPVKIERRVQPDGVIKWVLKMHEWVLGKDGNFMIEPSPSNRSDEYIQHTRFDSPEECYSFWTQSVKHENPLYCNNIPSMTRRLKYDTPF